MAIKGQQAAAARKVRVVCRIPNASDCMDGYDYGLLKIERDGLPVRVSEPLDDATAQRLCGIDGFERYEGDDAAAAAAVQEVRDGRRTSRASGGEQVVAELQRANRAMSDDLDAANAKIAELTNGAAPNKAQADKIASLVGELAERDQRFNAQTGQLSEMQEYQAELEKDAETRAARIAELEGQLTAANSRIADMEAQLTAAKPGQQ